MRRRVLIFACTAIAVVAALAPDPARAAWGTNNQHQLVPAYFYPDWWNTPNNWTRMCDAMNRTRGASTAIMNPNSGPSATANSDYAQAIAGCHTRGQHVIGYVHTSYGARALAIVRSEIDAYFAFYPGIDGIFLDEMSNDPATRAYYRSLYQYISGKPRPHEVVGNPGAAAATAWQLTTPVADAFVVFEGTAAAYVSWSPPSWVRSRVASTISNLVYATSDETTMRPGLLELQGQERRLHVRHQRRPAQSLGHAARGNALDQLGRVLSLAGSTEGLQLSSCPTAGAVAGRRSLACGAPGT